MNFIYSNSMELMPIYFHKELYAELEDASIEDQTSTTITIGTDENQKSYEIGSTFLTYVKSIDNDATESKFFDYCIFDDYDDSRYHKIVMYNMRTEFYVGFDTSAGHEVTLTNPNISAEYRSVIFNIADKQDIEVDSESKDKTVILFDNKTPVKASGGSNLGKKLTYLPSTTTTAEKTHLIDDYFNNIVADDKYRLGGPNSEGINVNIYDKLIQNKKETGGIYLQFLGNSNIVDYSLTSTYCEFFFTDLNHNGRSNFLNGQITLGSTLEFRLIIYYDDGHESLDFDKSKLGTYTFKDCCLEDKLAGFSIERVYYRTYDVKIPVVKEILEKDGSLIINIEAQQKNSYSVDFNEHGKVIKTLNVKSNSLNYDVSLTRKETTDSSGNTIVSFDKKEFNTAVGISDIYSISVYFQGTNEIDKRENFLYNELTDTIADYKIYDVSNCGKIYENDGYDTALNNDIFIVSNDDFAVNYVDVTISLANQVPLPQINDTVTGSSSDDSYLDNGGAGTGKCTQVFYYVDSNKRLKEYVFGSKIKALENEYIYICVLYNTTRISIDEENSYLSKNYEIMAMDGSSVFAPQDVYKQAQFYVNELFTTEGLKTDCKLLKTDAFKNYLCKYQGKDSGYAYATNDEGETLISLEINKRVNELLADYDYAVLVPQACSYAKSTVENAAIESASTAKNTYIEKQATAEALKKVNSDVLSDYINYIMMNTSYTAIPNICDEIETVNKNYNIYKDMKKSSLKDGTFYTEIKNITDSYLKSVSEESIDDKTNEKSIAYYRKGPLDDSDGFEDYKVGEINFIYDDYFSGYTMPTMEDCGTVFSNSGQNCLNSINKYVSEVTDLLEKIGNYYYSLNDTIKLKTAQLSALNTISNESNSEEVKKATYDSTLTTLNDDLLKDKNVTEKSKYNADKEAEQIRKDVSEKLSQEKAEKIYDYEINNTLEELKGIEDYDYTPQFSIKDYINDQLFEKKLLAIEKAIIKTISDEAALKASIEADKEASDKASIILTDDAIIKNSENLLFNQKAKFIYSDEYNKYLGGNYTETYRLGKAAAAENEFRFSTTIESFYSDAVKEVYNESYNYYYKDYYDSLYNEYYEELYTNAIEDDSEYVKKVLSSSEISNYIDSILDVMSNSDEIKFKASIDAKNSAEFARDKLARSLLTTLKKIIDEINRLNLNKSLYKKLANESSYSADENLTKLSLEVLPDSSKLLTTETYLFNKAAQKVYDDEYSSTQSVEKAETAKNAYIKSTDVSSFKSDANTLLTESEYLDKYSKSIKDESNICYNNLFVKDSSLKLPYADSRNPQDVYNDAIKNLSSSSSIKGNAELKALETVGRQELLDSITDGLKENLLAALNSSIAIDADKYAINKVNDESNDYALQKAEDYAIEKSQSESLDSSEIQSTATYLFNEGIIEAYNEKYASLNELVSEEYRVEEANLAKEEFLKNNTIKSFYSKAEEFIRKSLYEKYYKEGFEKYFEEKYNELFI